ncbi:MAG: hypothetical protein DRJ97_03255 [Thermoprotei archaeon]|nr:MAG: hypothetical protein DRJ97_03255 [Thermoprotei archaeon]
MSGHSAASLALISMVQGVHEVAEVLEGLYSERGGFEGGVELRPVLSVGGRLIEGPKIDDRRFRVLNPLPNRRRFLSVDASMKVLFDCGSFKVVLIKVAAAVWRWRSLPRRYPIRKRFALVFSKLDAKEVLLRAELEEIEKAIEDLGPGDYCVLDRPLMAVPALREETRRLLEELDDELWGRGVVLMGVCKASKLKLNTGESLIGYLNYRGSRLLRGSAWFYHPVFKSSQYPPWYVGEPCIVKFSGEAEHAFRVDVSRRALAEGDLERYLGELAFLQDASTPGYPYPVRGVHEDAKITEYEVEVDRALLLEELARRGLLERFLSDVRSSSFKEEALWGSIF